MKIRDPRTGELVDFADMTEEFRRITASGRVNSDEIDKFIDEKIKMLASDPCLSPEEQEVMICHLRQSLGQSNKP